MTVNLQTYSTADKLQQELAAKFVQHGISMTKTIFAAMFLGILQLVLSLRF